MESFTRRYGIGGLTLRVVCDLPITDRTFLPRFETFRLDESATATGDDIILRHHVRRLDLTHLDPGSLTGRGRHWEVYHKHGRWIYHSRYDAERRAPHERVAFFNRGHTRGRIFSGDDAAFRRGGLHSLSLLDSDQAFLARALADRQGCLLHSAGFIYRDLGLLFAGHSEAGKSTMVTMLRDEGEILCDDRIVVRRWPEAFHIFGTWSHGTVPEVSASSAPLRALLFLEKSAENRLIRLTDGRDVVHRLILLLVKPVVTPDWWDKVLTLIEGLVREVPAYRLLSDTSGRVREVLQTL